MSGAAPPIPILTASLAEQELRRDGTSLARRLRRLLCAVLRAGGAPRHVAFIMDGNRRFARQAGLDRAAGHARGFEKLLDALEWCSDLGVEEVTVYAFSIENFKARPRALRAASPHPPPQRPTEEVGALMALAESKLGELAARLGGGGEPPALRVIGDLSLLPPRVQAAAARACLAARGRGGARAVNVALAYTGREDCAQAASRLAEAVAAGWLHATDAAEPDALRACLHASRADGGGGAPQLLLRTSGERRLSDFALPHAQQAQLQFARTLWPQLRFRHLAAALLRFQAGAAGGEARALAARAREAAWAQARRLAALRGARAGAAGVAGGDAFERRFCAPGQAAASEAEAEALRALEAGRPGRLAAFLAERERALWEWTKLAAEGAPPPWPPPLRPCPERAAERELCRE